MRSSSGEADVGRNGGSERGRTLRGKGSGRGHGVWYGSERKEVTGSRREGREGMGEIGLGTLTALPVPFLVRAIRTGSFAVLGALAGRARMSVTACNGAISAAVSVVEVGAGEEGWVALSLVLAIGVALSRGLG